MLLSKSELIAILQKEIHILNHLCTKVEPSMLDYRPTPKQRSTIELLRYLSMMGPMIMPSIMSGTFMADQWKEAIERSATLDFPAVVAEIAAQSAFYASSIESASEDELQAEVELFGSTGSRAVQIINGLVAGHAAYRTQLFCYLKACGREELGTMNLWAGMDPVA
jgi:hypothetical protein